MFQARTQRMFPSVIAAVALATGSTAGAEVIDAEASGFTTRHSITIARPRSEVYRAATANVASWWIDDHTVSGSAGNLYLEPRVQGCLCERLGEHGGVVHLVVTFVNPTVMLRLTGGLGPLGLMGVSGNMTWEFTDAADGTTVTWSYAIGGYFPGGLDQMASSVDRVLIDQMNSFRKFVEE